MITQPRYAFLGLWSDRAPSNSLTLEKTVTFVGVLVDFGSSTEISCITKISVLPPQVLQLMR
ncbi:hypothetical protein JPSP29_04650 [Staphylococcus pseudintermedius]